MTTIHRHPHPPPHRHHEVHYNLEAAVGPGEYGQLLRRFAEQLEAEGTIRLTDDLSVVLPEGVQLTVRFERTPHGALALRASIEWQDRPDAGVSTGSLAELLQ